MACEHVLIVDDNEDLLLSIKDLLDLTVGARVEIAQGVEAADALLAGGLRPDAIVVDLKLGSESGLDYIARLRADPRYARTPVIAMSGAVATLRELVATGEVQAGLEKPFKPEDLIGALEDACRSGSDATVAP